MFNILIVEDDKELSQLFQKVLEKMDIRLNAHQMACRHWKHLTQRTSI